MPSIVTFVVGASRGDSTPFHAASFPGAVDAFSVVVVRDVDALLAAAVGSDAACVVLDGDPEEGFAIVRRLRAAAPDLAIVATGAPNPEAALVAAEAGAHETTPMGADHRLVTLALQRAVEFTADQRELRSLRAQHSADARPSPLTLLVGRPGDVRPVPSLREIEREAIRHALAATGGRVGQAAKMLGMGRATLYRRLAADDVVRMP